LVRLTDLYAAAEPIDRPLPTEIVHTLANPEYRERFNVPAQRIAAEVVRLIQACGAVNVFRDELSALESAANIGKQ
jgi:hypothetical protein